MILVPLGDQTAASVRESLAFSNPAWAAVIARGWAEYLGFTLGPERGERTWGEGFAQGISPLRAMGDLGFGIVFLCRRVQHLRALHARLSAPVGRPSAGLGAD